MLQLNDVVTILKSQNEMKADYIVPSSSIRMVNGMIEFGGKVYETGEVFHEGLSVKLGIPGGYYRRMREEIPELLDISVNSWLRKMGDRKVMVRAFEDSRSNRKMARAFLSDRYQIFDNYDVLFTTLQSVMELGINADIANVQITEKRLYINLICPEVEVDAYGILSNYLRERNSVGNGIISGICITNSEVGYGSFEIRPRAVIVKCQNGLIATDDRFRRIHLGSRLEEGQIVWSRETMKKNHDLVVSQVKDAIKTFLNPEYLGKVVERIQEAHNTELRFPADAVKNVCRELRYTDSQRDEILNYFIKGGDKRATGISHAITMYAQKEDPDTRFDMEMKAYEILPRIKHFDKPFTEN